MTGRPGNAAGPPDLATDGYAEGWDERAHQLAAARNIPVEQARAEIKHALRALNPASAPVDWDAMKHPEIRAGQNQELEALRPWRLYKRMTELEEQLEALRWSAQYVADMHPEGESEVDHKSMRRLRAALVSNPASERQS